MTAKRFFTLILACLMMLSLIACGNTTYRDDVSVGELSALVQGLIPVDGGYDLSGEDFIKYYFDFDGKHTIDGYAVAASSASSDVNEYGIFHLNDPKQVEEVAKLAQTYIEGQRDFLSTFVNTYNAAEMDKLDQMQVKVLGNYVIYTILSEADTSRVINAVEKALK